MNELRRIVSLVPAGRCRALLAAAALSSAASATAALVPALVVYVIARVIFERVDIGLSVMQVVFAGIAAVIVRLGLLLVARNAASTATELLSQSLRARAAVTIGALPLGVLAEISAGSFETILLDDVETLGQYVAEDFVDLIAAVAMLGMAAVVLASRDWRAAGIAAVLALGAVLAARGGAARAAARIGRERAAREKLTAVIFQTIRSLSLEASLPAAADAGAAIRDLAGGDRRAIDARQVRAVNGRVRGTAFAAAVPAAIVLAVAALAGPALDLPVLILFAALGLRVTGALGTLMRADAAAAPVLESARRIAELLARPTIVDGHSAPPSDTTLRFSKVAFGYPAGAGRPVLSDIEFTAEAGRVTAIVGPSGSGKTTLTRLAARLWDVDDGSVTLGGVDLRRLPVDALMQRVSCVFQDVALLDDTVAANLKLGRADASEDDVIRAATAAGAHDFICALPAAYQTLIGDRGLHLSRGERQRLQIARALLKDAPLVILDEPTSSMDPATELEVQAALAPLLAGKTVVVVAHRLATIVGADRIVVLSRDGRIEAQGSHADLLALSPTYARLWSDYGAAVDPSPTSSEAAIR